MTSFNTSILSILPLSFLSLCLSVCLSLALALALALALSLSLSLSFFFFFFKPSSSFPCRSLAKAEQEKNAKEHQIKTLQDEMAQQDELIAKLTREKKKMEEGNRVRRGIEVVFVFVFGLVLKQVSI